MTGKTPVVVLLGGPSAEHDVSIVSGTAIAAALDHEGYAVEQVLIGRTTLREINKVTFVE